MAATYLDIEAFPLNAIAGFEHRFRVTARNADGTVDAGFVGTVSFTSTDGFATLPAAYAYVGADAGTHLFEVKTVTTGAHTVTAAASGLTSATAPTTVAVQPPGWGFDDYGLLPYGDAVTSIGASIVSARAVSTHQVDVMTLGLVQDTGFFLAGDALNPTTWTVQRLDTGEFFHVVAVEQVGTYEYRLLCLEAFGNITVTHRVATSTLKDDSGNLINTPREADFAGILDKATTSIAERMAGRRVASRDYANLQVPSTVFQAGTLQVNGAGDYELESGAPLVKKLLLRRLMAKAGDFFHLPTYGLGLREKEPVPAADLGRLKASIEAQALKEPEVQAAAATLVLEAAAGILRVSVRAQLRKSGEQVEVGLALGAGGLVL